MVLKGYQSNIMTIIGWIQKKKWEDKQTDEWTHKETDRQETQRRQHIRTETSAEKNKRKGRKGNYQDVMVALEAVDK